MLYWLFQAFPNTKVSNHDGNRIKIYLLWAKVEKKINAASVLNVKLKNVANEMMDFNNLLPTALSLDQRS